MYLRSLRLRGFKSFPDPVEIRLEPGVAVVVGPNGSGKSNVADAIIWAAGSQSPSELRAEKPDDVLYAGSGARKPADFCEVELVFDNEDGAGPLPYSELSVSRRLHRGGEGQYLVNRAAVRRLDLVELLADLGLGGTMHSVIGQGRVEQILASKPAERRALVEEAAGLGKFKRRRHRAELKLARVRGQVDRARDLEDDVRRRLRPLALQATAAERAERLARDLSALQARLAELDLAELQAELEQGRARRTEAGHARRAAQERLESVLAERNAAEEELADAAGRREEATAALYRLRSAAERAELRREAAQALAARLAAEAAEAETAAGGPSPEVERLRREAEAAREAARERTAERDAALARLRPVLARLAALAAGTAEGVAGQRAAAEEELAAAARRRDESSRSLYRLAAASERLAVRREPVETLLEGLRADLELADAEAARAGPTPGELERRANDAAASARAAVLERDDLAERARSARERLAALERALAQREGIPPAARALADAGERLALSLLEAEPGAERAVAAALSWRAAAVLARDPAAGLALVEHARREGLGSLAVVVGRGQPPGTEPPLAGARPLAELASGPAEALHLLGGVWLVAPERLLEARRGTVVTAEGHGYDADRGELWFAGETAEAVILELESRRRELGREAEELERRARSAAAAAAKAVERAEQAEAAYAEVAPRRGLRPGEPAVLRRLADVAARLATALAAAGAAAGRIEEAARTSAERAAGVAEELLSETARLRAEETEARREAVEASGRLRAAEAGSDDRVAAPSDQTAGDAASVRASADQLAAEAAGAEQAAAEAQERARAAEASYAVAAPRPAPGADPASLWRLAAAAERLEGALRGATELAARFEAPLRGRADAGAVRTGELAAELRRLGAAEGELRREAAEAGERAAAVEVELARLEAEAREVRRRLESAPVPAAEGDDREELVSRSARLEQRLAALGQVNPLAREEYEREKERLEELAEQRADLEAGLTELEKLRSELVETVERRFSETYAAVERHFAEVAATLFPGGRGRLVLTEAEGEDEEQGIEIELQPAGKRITRLSLLSGGEKALGAISFLFALFLAHPCPFYLLDEVEAALDDTNIGRFVDLLRRFADRAQFVVVTHQKRTMEAADILYGVTMGADGISQVVSKRLQAEPLPALSA